MDKLIKKRVVRQNVGTQTLAQQLGPATSAQSALDPGGVEALRAFMRDANGSDASSPCAVAKAYVTAHPGTGLTTTLTLLGREMDLRLVWIGADVKNLQDALDDASATRIASNGQRKVIVLDECDAVLANKRSKAALVSYAGGVPLVCAGHPSRVSSRTAEFVKGWTVIAFPKLGFQDITPHLSRVPGADPKRVVAAAASTGGDLRAAFSALEMEMVSGKRAKKAKQARFAKDVFLGGLEAVDMLLTKKRVTIDECLDLCADNPVIVPMGIFENYPHVLARGDIDVAAAAVDSMSMSDVMYERMNATQAWELQDPHGVWAVAAPALELRQRKTASAMQTEKFGSVMSRIHNAQAKQKSAGIVNRARLGAGLDPMPVTDLGTWGTIIAAASDEAFRDACHPLGPHEVQCLMQLRVNKAVKYNHDRTKKLFKA